MAFEIVEEAGVFWLRGVGEVKGLEERGVVGACAAEAVDEDEGFKAGGDGFGEELFAVIEGGETDAAVCS